MSSPLLQASATAFFEGGVDGNLRLTVQITSTDPAIIARLQQFNQSVDELSGLPNGLSFESYITVQEAPPETPEPPPTVEGASSGALDAVGSKENKVVGS